ncbi:hypothetical protein [Tsukamurella hominis]|uniref:hypothetical protein n=1 Tax=Tsukamurella hominis TaxID=1970232 RepID=UPI0039EBD6D0
MAFFKEAQEAQDRVDRTLKAITATRRIGNEFLQRQKAVRGEAGNDWVDLEFDVFGRLVRLEIADGATEALDHQVLEEMIEQLAIEASGRARASNVEAENVIEEMTAAFQSEYGEDLGANVFDEDRQTEERR